MNRHVCCEKRSKKKSIARAEQAPPLAVVGTVAVDSVETPFGKRESVFGGSASFFSYAASFFSPVALVAVVGEDFPEEYRQILMSRPIDLAHLETVPGKTFHWKGKYEQDLNTAVTLETQLNVLLEFNPKLSFKSQPAYVFLANVDPVIQAKVLDQMEKPRPKFVACDTMNFWIANKREALLRVLARVDCVLLNDGESRQLTGESNLILAARKVRELGPSKVIIKKGEHGVVFFDGTRYFALPAFPLESLADPTGAGDTFAGGFMGYLAQTDDLSYENLKRAVSYGSITASFTVEDFGLERLQRLTRRQIDKRLELFKKMSTFI